MKKLEVFLMFLGFALSGPIMAAEFSTGDQFQSEGAEIEVSQVQSCVTPSFQTRRALREFVLFSEEEISCSERRKIEGGFNTASVLLGAGSAVAACTAAGVPVSIMLTVGSAATSMMEMIVKHLPCDDSVSEQAVQAKTKELVCGILSKQGIFCNSNEFILAN